MLLRVGRVAASPVTTMAGYMMIYLFSYSAG
jgi:hypothetical protein